MADDPQVLKVEKGWMSDVQRALALILIGSFALVTIYSTVCSVLWPDATALTDMAKTLQAAMVNMGLVALGFFFGSNMSKMMDDAGKQRIVEKLTSTNPQEPAGGPVAPVSSTTVVVTSWWSLLEPGEKTAITNAAETDARVADILAALKSGKAEANDIDDLAAKGLLTPDRAKEIQAA